jgi:hypothetical protein
MSKSNTYKVLGFVGTLGVSAALVGSAVAGTGAYFTDSHDGSISGASGHLKMNTTDPNLAFGDLNPGEDKVKTVDFNVDGTTSTASNDVWLVFNPADPAFAALTGAKGGINPGGGLGRYGHFAVANNGGAPLFQSYNLQALPAGGVDPVCIVDANGQGGSSQQATSRTDTPPLCGIPTAIRIASGLAPGQAGRLDLTFGLTGRQAAQGQAMPTVPFKLVATQHNIRPDAASF